MTAVDSQMVAPRLHAPEGLAARLRGRLERAGLALVRLSATAAETALAVAWLSGGLQAERVLAAHAAVVAALAALAWATRRRPQSDLWTLTALVALAGPLGALAPLFGRDRARDAMRDAGSAGSSPTVTLSRAEAIEADLVAGRRPRRDPANRASLMDRLRDGDLQSQQFAISMISLRYDPALHPVLLAALRSPAPAVRVQAAAVFAKLRERFAAEAKALLDPARAPAGPEEARAAARSCRELARNPFMDEAVAAALAARAAAIDPSAEASPAQRCAASGEPAAEVEPGADVLRGRVA